MSNLNGIELNGRAYWYNRFNELESSMVSGIDEESNTVYVRTGTQDLRECYPTEASCIEAYKNMWKAEMKDPESMVNFLLERGRYGAIKGELREAVEERAKELFSGHDDDFTKNVESISTENEQGNAL